MADELPEGVRPDVVAALLMPDESDFAEYALNSTEQERELAAQLHGRMADFDGWDSYVMLGLIHELRPYWRDPKQRLMDVIAAAPGDVRMRCLRLLDAGGFLPT